MECKKLTPVDDLQKCGACTRKACPKCVDDDYKECSNCGSEELFCVSCLEGANHLQNCGNKFRCGKCKEWKEVEDSSKCEECEEKFCDKCSGEICSLGCDRQWCQECSKDKLLKCEGGCGDFFCTDCCNESDERWYMRCQSCDGAGCFFNCIRPCDKCGSYDFCGDCTDQCDCQQEDSSESERSE